MLTGKKQFAKQYIQIELTHVFVKTDISHTHAYLVKNQVLAMTVPGYK